MKTIKIRNIEIGAGIPKICAPIVGRTADEILKSAATITTLPVDLVEWRIDWYEDVFDVRLLLDTLHNLRHALGDLPLLVTFRTKAEGGEKSISLTDYVNLYKAIVASRDADLIDLEMFSFTGVAGSVSPKTLDGSAAIGEIIEAAHKTGIIVIGSNHDFEKTPEKDILVARLRSMQEAGADIPKIAVMPQSRSDVLTLLAATEEMYTNYAAGPIITMSMGREGVTSRLMGESFGSAVTFGSVGKSSAPGQIEATKLKVLLESLHQVL